MQLENEDRLTRMFEESRITTRLRGPREPPSYQSIFRPSPKLDKGKAKMSGYEEPIDNASNQSLNSDFEILDRWSKESIRICKRETPPLDPSKEPRQPLQLQGLYGVPLQLHDEGDFSAGAGDAL